MSEAKAGDYRYFPPPGTEDAEIRNRHVHEIRMRCIEAAVAGVQSGDGVVPSEVVLVVARQFTDYVLGPASATADGSLPEPPRVDLGHRTD